MPGQQRELVSIAARVTSVLCGLAAAALAAYAVLLVYAAVTYDSEGAPGPLVLYMVAVGLALAALLPGGIARLVWNFARGKT